MQHSTGTFLVRVGQGPRAAGRIGTGRKRFVVPATAARDVTTPPASAMTDKFGGQTSSPHVKFWHFSTTSPGELKQIERELARNGFVESFDAN
jgi:hypothetical protein